MTLAVVGVTSLIKCSFGLVPTPLIVLPDRTIIISGMLMGNITDFKPMVNITNFVMCTSMANPQVATATAISLGALTPMPCLPIVISPWVPGAINVLTPPPALDQTSMCMCIWAGVITVIQPGQFHVIIP